MAAVEVKFSREGLGEKDAQGAKAFGERLLATEGES